MLHGFSCFPNKQAEVSKITQFRWSGGGKGYDDTGTDDVTKFLNSNSEELDTDSLLSFMKEEYAMALEKAEIKRSWWNF